MTRIPRAVLACAAIVAAANAPAQQSRQLNRILTPPSEMKLAPPPLPPGARVAATQHPVPITVVDTAVRQIAAAWNTSALRPLLANNFLDRDRLLDALRRAPRDARLRVLAVEGARTLDQWLEDAGTPAEQRVSRVSATVRTQVEFNDVRAGFRRIEGTNELTLLVREPNR